MTKEKAFELVPDAIHNAYYETVTEEYAANAYAAMEIYADAKVEEARAALVANDGKERLATLWVNILRSDEDVQRQLFSYMMERFSIWHPADELPVVPDDLAAIRIVVACSGEDVVTIWYEAGRDFEGRVDKWAYRSDLLKQAGVV